MNLTIHNMTKKESIQYIHAREILDSRGNPTIEVSVALKDGYVAKASVPAGTSTGEHEAWELRDNDPNRYDGLGVLKACEHVNGEIAKALKGKPVLDQEKIDEDLIGLDGTKNKGRLGANALLGVSLACARAGAHAAGFPLYQHIKSVFRFPETSYSLPVPMFNIFNGGKHADTNLDFQEFMIVPVGVEGFREQVRMGAEIFHTLGKILVQKGLDTDVGIQGGYAPNLDASTDALQYILDAVEAAGFTAGSDIKIAIDVGASTFYDEHKHQYIFRLDESFLTSDQLISLYAEWATLYPIFSIEDGLDQNDWLGWKQMSEELLRRKDMLVVGDDIFVTNVDRLSRGIAEEIGNAIVIKPNQVGTLSEAISCVRMAQKAGYKVIVSQRSGDTTDDFIADLAAAINADFIKSGSLSRGERVCKYNRLMEIESEIN